MLAAMLRNKKNWSGKAVWQSTSRNIKWSKKTSEEKARYLEVWLHRSNFWSCRYKKDLASEMESIFTPEMIPTEKDISALLNATKSSPFEVHYFELGCYWHCSLRLLLAPTPAPSLVFFSFGS
jgi:hypothetical protein